MYKQHSVLYFLCGRIGHARRDYVHPETLDANMEGINLLFTSILYLVNVMEKVEGTYGEDNMTNMLINPFNLLSSLMIYHNFASSQGRNM